MIIEFSVKNFRSIKELQTLSFVATGLKSPAEYPNVDLDNIFTINDTKLLRSIGVYGSNASGKSNLIKALVFFLRVVSSEASSITNSFLKSLHDPFLYQNESENSESFFQIVLLINEKKYRYGFTLKRNLVTDKNQISNINAEIISAEWLYGTKEQNMGEYFTRENMEIKKDRLPGSEVIPNLPYEHSLFLTHAAAFDSDGVCAEVKEFLNRYSTSNITTSFDRYRFNSVMLIEDAKEKTKFLSILSSFGLKYDDINIVKDDDKQEIVPQDKIFFTKSFSISNIENQTISLNLKNTESSGTQKLFDLAGLFLRVFSFHRNFLVIIDEIDSNFHPALLIKLIQLFNNPEINRSNSQLLFTSHDTNLMSPEIMRRDQFYFTEKGDDNSTRLYSLSDLKGIRNDADFARDYLKGFYGGLPILQDYKHE